MYQSATSKIIGQPFMHVSHLTKCYLQANQEQVIFQDVSFGMGRGETVALLGRSGSGKSSLLNIISGIDTPTSGDVTIDGECLTTMSEKQRTLFRRRHIGFVFQFFNLIPTLTCEENLLLPLTLQGKVSVARRQQALALLAEVGLASHLQRFPEQLSGGEQQRLAIVRALVHSPSLVLADEPTGNLDAETAEHILNLLRRLVKETHIALLLVTHSNEAALLADRIIKIHHGQLIEDSPRERE